MKFLKIGLRNNLFYLMMLTIFNFLREIDTIVIEDLIELNGSLLLTFCMFFGEFIAGLIIFSYQSSFFPKQKDEIKVWGMILIQAKSDISYPDSDYKIYFLIFIASYFDFIEFMMATFYIPQYKNISKSLVMRLNGMLTLSAALLCHYLLKLPFLKHQIFSLLIVFACFITVLISEYIFKIIYSMNLIYFTFVIALIFMNGFFTAFKDVIEKYLLEIDYINPFKMLMIEGIFGCILTFIYCFVEEPFENLIDIYDKSKTKFNILILCLFLFFFFSGGRNAYRVITNKIYSPMTRTLTDSILDPLLIIYYYIFQNDFKIHKKQKQNIIYFTISLFISIIIAICGCIYNDVLILLCCNLQSNTHHFVSIRAHDFDNSYNLIKNSSQSDKSDNSGKDNLIEKNSSEDNTESNNTEESLSE